MADGEGTPAPADQCLLCHPAAADAHFGRLRVWQDELWRLSVVTHGVVVGFAHLEPIRHIPYVTDLDAEEARTFGPTLAFATRALRAATNADKIYAYVFGDHVPHFHVNLAPHRPGDALRGGPGLLEPDAPEAHPTTHARAVMEIRRQLSRP